MNPWLALMIGSASGGSPPPQFVGAAQTYQSANNTSESAIILKTDGGIYELDGVTETYRGNWLRPGHKAGVGDYSVYCGSVGMETGDLVGEWISVGDVQRKWGVTSAGLQRNNTIYFSFGVRSGTTLGATDHQFASTVEVPL